MGKYLVLVYMVTNLLVRQIVLISTQHSSTRDAPTRHRDLIVLY